MIYLILLSVLMIGIFLALTRLIKGPTIADRVVALVLMSTMGIGVTCIYAINTDQAVLLDVVLVFALLTFLGTIAFAYYLQRRV
jgi:multicomponent Na+:H+ antiporter subunit F